MGTEKAFLHLRGSKNDIVFDGGELEVGYTALKKISKVLGIPGLYLKTDQKHD